MSTLIVILLFAVLGRGAETCEWLHFDDITQSTIYGTLEQPYHDFIFEHDDPSWTTQRIGLINTAVRKELGILTLAAPSLPNALMASSDTIRLRHRATRFDFMDVRIRAVALSQTIYFKWDTGTRNINFEPGVTTLVTLNLTNITYILIGCQTLRLEDLCGPILYDDFRLCY